MSCEVGKTAQAERLAHQAEILHDRPLFDSS